MERKGWMKKRPWWKPQLRFMDWRDVLLYGVLGFLCGMIAVLSALAILILIARWLG